LLSYFRRDSDAEIEAEARNVASAIEASVMAKMLCSQALCFVSSRLIAITNEGGRSEEQDEGGRMRDEGNHGTAFGLSAKNVFPLAGV
jgi:hypothetical protein